MSYFDVLSLWLWHIFWDDDTWSLLSVSVVPCHLEFQMSPLDLTLWGLARLQKNPPAFRYWCR